MVDRRLHFRKPVDIFFNKYVEGYPHLCRALDLSPGGLLASAGAEPATELSSFALEFRLPGQPRALWVWAERVWRQGRREALRFVSADDGELRRLKRSFAALR